MASEDTRGLFCGKPLTEEPQATSASLQVSANSLQRNLGLSPEQASKLAEAANQPYQIPYKAGIIDTGEVFLITQQEYRAGFQGYENFFHVFVMQSDELKELPVQRAGILPDGSSRIATQAAIFSFNLRGQSTVGGRSLTKRLDELQLV